MMKPAEGPMETINAGLPDTPVHLTLCSDYSSLIGQNLSTHCDTHRQGCADPAAPAPDQTIAFLPMRMTYRLALPLSKLGCVKNQTPDFSLDIFVLLPSSEDLCLKIDPHDVLNDRNARSFRSMLIPCDFWMPSLKPASYFQSQRTNVIDSGQAG
jgi:hypothetical protein